jgi:hypothetical protein
MDSSNISTTRMTYGHSGVTVPSAHGDTITSPISFLGVTIVENGSSDPRIKKALNKSFKLLDIMEFIKVTGNQV